jgi:hypothetical protein
MSILTAKTFLNGILTTEKIEAAATFGHNDGWLANKKKALEDLNNPFRGYGESRIRVRDLSVERRVELGIADDADATADVFHFLFREFSDLDADNKNKNVPPLAILCYTLGDFLIKENTSLEELKEIVVSMVDGSNKEAIGLVSRINHVAFQSMELRVGSRPFGKNARTDFPLFSSLADNIAKLDEYTILPAAQWLVKQIEEELQK